MTVIYGGLGARATPWINQMGYITVIARVARDLWQPKLPLSLGYAHGLRSVYYHKSLALCYNYNKFPSIHIHMVCNVTAFCVIYYVSLLSQPYNIYLLKISIHAIYL